jgi:hypothetical protein
MQNEARLNHAKMVSPSTGFASRVMARIEERERAQARQRAVIGAGLLVAAAIALLAFVAIWIAGWISAVLASPGAILTTALVVSPLASDWLDALRIAAFAILQNVNVVILLVYALGVLALTTFWAEIATGNFQLSRQVYVGGQRK